VVAQALAVAPRTLSAAAGLPEPYPSGDRRDGRREGKQGRPLRFDDCFTEGERKTSAVAQVRRSSSDMGAFT